MNILDNIKGHPFCFLTFGVRRSIDVLDSKNQPGSGSGSRTLRLTEDACHLKYENKKEGFWKYLEYSVYKILKIFLRWGTKPWIRVWAKTGSTSLEIRKEYIKGESEKNYIDIIQYFHLFFPRKMAFFLGVNNPKRCDYMAVTLFFMSFCLLPFFLSFISLPLHFYSIFSKQPNDKTFTQDKMLK